MYAARISGLIAIIVFTLVSLSSVEALGAEAEGRKAVLVTGASTGIGRKITEVLADQGYFVYAGARKQADLDALNALDNVRALKLDVTIQEDIDAAVAAVEAGGLGLHGLINNAGVFIGGPLIDVDLDEFQWLMDINVNGVYRVTQAFAPMIIESRGRISTIGSISGTLSGRFSGHYSMSKHAIEAYTDSLAAEMAPLGVHVSVIEPGNYNSAIAESAQERMRARKDEYASQNSPFAEDFSNWIERDWDRSVYKEPDEVAEAAVHAMSADEPLRRYMVVPREEEAGRTIDKQIEELVQLNEWQAYSYSREELIARLDAVAPSEGDVQRLTSMLDDFLANATEQEAHAQFWADDLVYTSSNGTRFGKADIMAGFENEESEGEGPEMSYSGEDVNVQVFGTTAVLTFKLVGTPADGSDVKSYFNTGTFLKRGGKWRAVAWQATIIPAD